MKTNNIFRLLTLALAAFAFAFVTSCEGPAGPQGAVGPAGADGTNGEDGQNGQDINETCKICHNSATDVLNRAQDQFAEGGHSAGTYYDRAGECAGCHNTEGFLSRASSTDEWTDIQSFTSSKTQISCYTCHNVHATYTADDWGITYGSAVTKTLFGRTSPAYEQVAMGDIGGSNLCLQCHQSRDRGNVPAADDATAVEITSSHWGPHYGVQGAILNAEAGAGGVQVGTGYPTGGAHAGMANACITCHMPEGNHNLEITTSTCATSGCHPSVTDATDKQKALKTEIRGYMTEIGEALTTAGVMKINYTDDDGYVYYGPAGAGSTTAANAKAVWNYMVAYQDHSYGMHNPVYLRTLLKNSKTEIGL